MKKLMLAAFCVLALCPVFGQVVKLTNATDSPISYTGTAAYSAKSTVVNVSGHNLTAKPMVLVVANIYSTGYEGVKQTMYYQHDFFFKQNEIAPSSDFEITDISWNVHVLPQGNAPRTAPHAEGETLFVQFADGTTWGDSKNGLKALTERKQAEELLKAMVSAYQSGGESALLPILAPDVEGGTYVSSMVKHLRMVQADSGTAALMEDVKARLAKAESRRANGNFL
jgi:hypothetical protein